MQKISPPCELRRCSQHRDFNKANRYYFNIETDEILDATTVNKDNFAVTTTGKELPVVADAVYLASTGQVRLYLNEEFSEYISSEPYEITSDGVKNTDGNTVLLSSRQYFTSEEEAELYDISIANIWFKQGDATCYLQPSSGPCDVHIRVVNSSYESKKATLQISAIGANATRRILKQEEITLAKETEITKSYEELLFSTGERLNIKLLK